jgi:hypothetical protein
MTRLQKYVQFRSIDLRAYLLEQVGKTKQKPKKLLAYEAAHSCTQQKTVQPTDGAIDTN